MKVLIISADGFEDTELLVPLYRIREVYGEVDVASLEVGQLTGKQWLLCPGIRVGGAVAARKLRCIDIAWRNGAEETA